MLRKLLISVLVIALMVALVLWLGHANGAGRANRNAGDKDRITLESRVGAWNAILVQSRVDRTATSSPPWGARGEQHLSARERKPWLMVESLRIRHGSEEIVVPRSAFAALAFVNTMTLLQLDDGDTGCVVYMDGADASEGWRCELTVKGSHVTRRLVHSSEFPDNFREATNYVSVQPNN
jgi:hypothetical protein